MSPEADLDFTEAIESSLVAEIKPLEAASILFCARIHSFSAPKEKMRDTIKSLEEPLWTCSTILNDKRIQTYV